MTTTENFLVPEFTIVFQTLSSFTKCDIGERFNIHFSWINVSWGHQQIRFQSNTTAKSRSQDCSGFRSFGYCLRYHWCHPSSTKHIIINKKKDAKHNCRHFNNHQPRANENSVNLQRCDKFHHCALFSVNVCCLL